MSSFAAETASYDRLVNGDDINYISNKNDNGDYIEYYDQQSKAYVYMPKLRDWVLGPYANDTGETNGSYCSSLGKYHAPTQTDISNLKTLLKINDPQAIKIAETLDVDTVGGGISVSKHLQQDEGSNYFFLFHDSENDLYDLYDNNVYSDTSEPMRYTCTPN